MRFGQAKIQSLVRGLIAQGEGGCLASNLYAIGCFQIVSCGLGPLSLKIYLT